MSYNNKRKERKGRRRDDGGREKERATKLLKSWDIVLIGNYEYNNINSLTCYLCNLILIVYNAHFVRLLQDYTSLIIPNAVRATLIGHKGNVKCVEFVGEAGREIVSGSRYTIVFKVEVLLLPSLLSSLLTVLLRLSVYSDNTIRVWDTETSKQLAVFEGHESRIWDVSSNKNGTIISSASGDSTIKVS